MKQFWAGACALAVLAACGDGNPFTGGTTTAPTAPGAGTTVPANVQGDVASFTYDPGTGTLTVNGLTADADALNGTYVRKPALDRPGYVAYAIQGSPTERHVTAFVQQYDNTSGGIFVSGGQFGAYFGGGLYGRDGAYDPGTGVVQYGGNYIGLTNIPGDSGDLLPPPAGTPVGLLPQQAGEVTGTILITADFTDSAVEGRVTNRVFADTGVALEDIDLDSAPIQGDGTFSGSVSRNNISRGNFGGIFGGTDSRVIAGSLFAQDHINAFTDEEEHGLFVLVQCGTPGASPICP